jgi:hypothetical protein
MRPLRFALFLVLIAALLSAAGYLWAPLVSPKFETLHLAAPPIESRVIEPPLRIRPADLLAPSVRRLLPLHVAGSVHVVARRLELTPAPPTVRIIAAPHLPAPTPAPVVAVAQHPVAHHAAAQPVPAPKVAGPKVAAPKASEPQVVQPVAPAGHEVHPVLPKPAPTVGRPAPPAVVVPVPAPAPAPEPAPQAPLPVTTTPNPPADVAAQPATIAAAPAAPAVPAGPSATPPAAVTTPTTSPPPPTTTTGGPPPTTTPGPTPPPGDGDDDDEDDDDHDSGRPGWGCGDRNHDHTGPPNAKHSSPC